MGRSQHPVPDGKGSTRPVGDEVHQVSTATVHAPALATPTLMEQVSGAGNLRRACKASSSSLRCSNPQETAVYDEYVRWCGRTGRVSVPPTRSFRNVNGMHDMLSFPWKIVLQAGGSEEVFWNWHGTQEYKKISGSVRRVAKQEHLSLS